MLTHLSKLTIVLTCYIAWACFVRMKLSKKILQSDMFRAASAMRSSTEDENRKNFHVNTMYGSTI